LDKAIEFVRDGDVFAITKLDRLARSVADFVAIQKLLDARGVTLRVLALGMDTGTPTGKLMLNVVSSVAQFEREIMLERQREGVIKARRAGKYKGRKPTARNQAAQIATLANSGLSKAAIAKELGLSERSVFRVLATAASV
jgi:DNA invertase Pin-like site-specific DNA recombinase